MKILFRFLMLLVFVFGNTIVFAQTDTTDYSKYAGKVVSIKLKNGTIYSGRILEVDKSEIGINDDKKGMTYIPLSDIDKITESHSIGSGNYSSDETYATRYFVTPNYLNMEKGENYGKFSVFGPEIQIAAGKRLTIGAMMTWLGSPLAVTAKISFPLSKKVHFGFGTLVGWGGILGPSAMTALPFSGFTFGDAKANISLSGGWGYSSFISESTIPGGTTTNAGQQPIFTLAGMKKNKDGVTLVFESVIVPFTPGNSQPIITFTPGIRFHRKYTRSMQVGLMFIYFDGKVQPYPIPSLSWLFQVYKTKM